MAAMTLEERIKKAGLLHMSGDESITPELIDDAIDGTLEVHKHLDLSSFINSAEGDQSASSGKPG